MKQRNKKFITSASLAAAALTVGPYVFAQSQSSGSYNQPTRQESSDRPASSSMAQESSQSSSSSSSDTSSLRLASKDDAKHTVAKLSGKKLHGQDNHDLGTVKDFLIDPPSGDVRFAVVSTGGFAGIGDKLHAVPFASLQQDGDRGFTAQLTKDELNQARQINEEQFEENRITLNDQAQQDSQTSASQPSGQLVRASKIDGRDVKANGNKLGRIEGLVIEQGAHTAMALLKPDQQVGSSDQTFLVPLSRFTMAGKDEITTTLTQTDLQNAAQSGQTASAKITSSSSNVAEASSTGSAVSHSSDSLSPTGRSSSFSQPASGQIAANAPMTVTASPNTATNSSDQTSSTTGSSNQFAGTSSSAPSMQSSATSNATDASSTANSGRTSQWSANGAQASNDRASSSAAATDDSRFNTQSAGDGTSGRIPANSASVYGKSSDGASNNSQGSSDRNQTTTRAGVYGLTSGSVDANSTTPSSSQGAANTSSSAVASTDTPTSASSTRADADAMTDTAHAQTGSEVAVNTGNDEGITPTGQTSADQTGSTDPKLVTAVHAIRQALDNDPMTAHADVRVRPENGKIALKGKVSSDSLKSSIESKARGAANGIDIDSQLKVSDQK